LCPDLAVDAVYEAFDTNGLHVFGEEKTLQPPVRPSNASFKIAGKRRLYGFSGFHVWKAK